VIVVETDDFAGGQIGRDSTHEDLLVLDCDTIYPLAGHIHVAGAEPGDVLAVELLGFELPDWGWAAAIVSGLDPSAEWGSVPTAPDDRPIDANASQPEHDDEWAPDQARRQSSGRGSRTP
jgi:hypothetical protein